MVQRLVSYGKMNVLSRLVRPGSNTVQLQKGRKGGCLLFAPSSPGVLQDWLCHLDPEVKEARV